MEAKAKVKDIAISRERVTLRDVLHEGTCLPCALLRLSSSFFLCVSQTPKKLPHQHSTERSKHYLQNFTEKWNTNSECLLLALQKRCWLQSLLFLSLALLMSLTVHYWSSRTSWCRGARGVCSGIIQKPQIIEKDFLKNANTDMQTNEQSNKTLICWWQ